MKRLKASYDVMALLLGAAMAGPASAHHSFGMFDMQKTVTVEGTVKDFQWTNPHIWIDLMVTDPRREQMVWSVEGDAVTIMTRRGWNRNALKPGDKVKITAHPLKTGGIGGSLVSASVNGTPIGTGQAFPPR